jgi:hypothetical protein
VFVIVAVVADAGTICTGFALVVTSFATQKYEVVEVKVLGNVIVAAFEESVD